VPLFAKTTAAYAQSMSPIAVGGIVFASFFGSALPRMTFGTALPAHHLSSVCKDAVKLATAIVATPAESSGHFISAATGIKGRS
jgi:hypothetical protein